MSGINHDDVLETIDRKYWQRLKREVRAFFVVVLKLEFCFYQVRWDKAEPMDLQHEYE
jgi:hypothetical protein